MKINKNQVIVLWIAVSMLLPILYLGGKAFVDYGTEIKSAEIGFIPDPYEKQPRDYRLKNERKLFIDILGIIIFEILSISGLLIYIFKRRDSHLTSR